MIKHVDEDWSFFNTAVRERAESRPRPEPPTLRVVTPEAFPMPPGGTVTLAHPSHWPPTAQPPAQPGPGHSRAPGSVAPPGAGHWPPAQPLPVEPNPGSPTPPDAAAAPSRPGHKAPTQDAPSNRGPEAPKPFPSAIRPPGLEGRPRPLGEDGVARIVMRTLFALVAIVLLFALASTPKQNSDWPQPPLLPISTSPAPREDASNKGPAVADYTVFNRVALKDWLVVTGWTFARNGDASPSNQYCYLEVTNSVGRQTYSIEDRPSGVREQRPDMLIPGLDDAGWQEASGKCQWHSKASLPYTWTKHAGD